MHDKIQTLYWLINGVYYLRLTTRWLTLARLAIVMVGAFSNLSKSHVALHMSLCHHYYVLECSSSCMYFVHYGDVIMGTIASQITSLTIVYSTVYSDADQRKHQSSASPAFVRGIHRGPVNSPHKWPVTRKMFPFDDVIVYPLYVPC